MSAADLAAVVVVVAALAASAALAVSGASLRRSARRLDAAAAAFEAEALPLLDRLRRSAADAERQVQRVDDLIDTAAAIGDTVDAATSLTYRALANPVIKTVALGAGAGRAAWRLRRGAQDGSG